jgi:hypothetical protein
MLRYAVLGGKHIVDRLNLRIIAIGTLTTTKTLPIPVRRLGTKHKLSVLGLEGIWLQLEIKKKTAMLWACAQRSDVGLVSMTK